jgi:hypothetical protein
VPYRSSRYDERMLADGCNNRLHGTGAAGKRASMAHCALWSSRYDDRRTPDGCSNHRPRTGAAGADAGGALRKTRRAGRLRVKLISHIVRSAIATAVWNLQAQRTMLLFVFLWFRQWVFRPFIQIKTSHATIFVLEIFRPVRLQ